MHAITIDGARISSRKALFDTIYAAVGAQGEPGHNLDALHDVLTSLDGVSLRIENGDALRSALGDYYDRLTAMLSSLRSED